MPPRARRANARHLSRAMGDREGLSPDAAAAQAREAVATLRTHGWVHADGDALRIMFDLLHPNSGAEVQVAAAHAALDAGALPVLTVAMQQTSHQRDTAAVSAHGQACFVLGTMVVRVSKSLGSNIWLAAMPEAVAAFDAAAYAVTRGAANAGLPDAACFALCALCVNGARPSDAAAAAAAACGAVEALAAGLSPLTLSRTTVFCAAGVLRILFTEHPEWPAECLKSVTAAFLQAGGLDTLVAALDAHGDHDDTLETLLAAFRDVVLVAPRELVSRLSTADEVYGILTRALQRASLPFKGRATSIYAAILMARDDATAHACLARTGLLDAAAAAFAGLGGTYGDSADAVRLVCACANVIALAAQSCKVPSDVAATLHALARAAPTPAARAREQCFTALRILLELPGVVDMAIAGDLAGTLVATVRAACNDAPDASVCIDALRALVHFSLRSDDAKHAVLHADGIDAAVQALRSHPRDTIVALRATELLYSLSRGFEHDGAIAIGAADGWIPLVAALRGHGAGDAVLSQSACSVLTMGASEADCCSAVAAAGAIPAITGAMHAHLSDSDLQDCCVTALLHFAACGLQFADLLAAARAASAVTAAMVQHAADAALQRVGCITLLYLCEMPSTAQQDTAAGRRALSAAVSSGAPAALVAALRMHASSVEDVRIHAPRVLAITLVAGSWPSDSNSSWCEMRNVLLAHIASHGCFDSDGNTDDLTLMLATRLLYETPVASFAGGPVPSGAVPVLCMALRTAIELCSCAADDEEAKELKACLALTSYAGKACAYVAHLSGAESAAFKADACGAGLVELLITAAADGARVDGNQVLGDSTSAASALFGLAVLLVHAPEVQCRAAACGAHALAEACKRAGAFADVCAEHRDAAGLMSRRLRALVTEHEDGECELPHCVLRLMSRHRCCLPDCDAVPEEGARFKHCERCRCAAYCCREHQVQAYPQHKAVCKARAAVDAARAALAQATAHEGNTDA
jgi:hypothetical protein